MAIKYINAKDLLNEVYAETVEGRIFDGNIYVGTFNVIPVGDITEIVNYMPAADVVEVKHGKWEEDAFKAWCSNCETYFSMINIRKETFLKVFHFCPNCGADMRGDKDTNVLNK